MTQPPSHTRDSLEAQLLRDPFDPGIRRLYAEMLLRLGEVEASLEQWRLLVRQSPEAADPRIAVALCLHRLGRESESAEQLTAAGSCSDFDATDSRLEELDPRPTPDNPHDRMESASPAPLRANLRSIPGGRTDLPVADVVSIGSTDVIRFSDVVGMEKLKKTIRLSVIQPFLQPGLFERFKKKTGGGVLLYGPPGCGKTMMARAIATECDASFTAVGISDILNLWSGQSEQNLSAIFEMARSQTPAVLFFDELDALAFSRSKARSEHTRTLVNEFLNQLDGMSGRNHQVLVLGATNMPWDVDDAMKRPGRFDRQVFVPPPDEAARAEMFRQKLLGVPCEALDFAELGQLSRHFSGADIDGVLELAKETVLTEILESDIERGLSAADLQEAIGESAPSTLEWLKTVRNVVKFGGGGRAYRDVEKYLRREKMF
ncbi:MAG: ATP-binding protein [Thermoanaerobaculia bacterium]|nr:ATP-binding protein [Thermoanaerobaculia bacterium]